MHARTQLYDCCHQGQHRRARTRWRALLLGARMVMLLPVALLHQDAPARDPQFTNLRTLWNWLRSLHACRKTHLRLPAMLSV